MLASLVLMTVDHRYDYLDRLRYALNFLVHPVYLAVDMPSSAGRTFKDAFKDRKTLQEDNAQLHTKQLLLDARLQKMAALEAENIRLRKLSDASYRLGERFLIADIFAVDLDPYKHQVLINKGAYDDVYEGQTVLDAQGVMGQIIHVDPFSARAILVTDPSHAIPVQINRTGQRTIAVGNGNARELLLPHLPNNADVRTGDLIVTSGLGDRFPAGYPVGKIQKIDREAGKPFADIIASPAAELDRSQEVILVWTRPPVNPAPPPTPTPSQETTHE
jgi:rod shape-determining protein MreC